MSEREKNTDQGFSLSDLAVPPPNFDPREEERIDQCVEALGKGMGSQPELRKIQERFGHTTYAAAIARKRARDLLDTKD